MGFDNQKRERSHFQSSQALFSRDERHNRIPIVAAIIHSNITNNVSQNHAARWNGDAEGVGMEAG